jgi:hypothetical protein
VEITFGVTQDSIIENSPITVAQFRPSGSSGIKKAGQACGTDIPKFRKVTEKTTD